MKLRQFLAGSMIVVGLVMAAARVQAQPNGNGYGYFRNEENTQRVPEPATGVLLIAGGLTLAARNYLRSRRGPRKPKGE